MNRKTLIVPACIACAALGALVGSLATAAGDKGAADMKLPKGWTAEDMQACMAAGTPGKEHAQLVSGAGEWEGTCTQWMGSEADPMTSKATSKVSPFMDGRYVKCEYSGDMPGMGNFTGLGYQGFDNVSKKYVSSWLDNMGTGIMYGTGDLSSDGKTMTWTYVVNCPIAKKPVVMREVQTTEGNHMTLEMFSTDPKNGKEFRAMKLDLTRKG